MTAAGTWRVPALPQLLLVAVLIAVLGYPLLVIVVGSVGVHPDAFARMLFAPGAGRAWLNTLWVGCLASVLALGLASGAVAATTAVPGRLAGAARAGLVLPLLVPPFASAVGWSQAYGPGGMTDVLFHLPVRQVIGPAGVLLATAAEVMPIAYLVLAGSTLVSGNRPAVLGARASGSSRWDAYRRVTLPLTRPAAAAALALAFLAAVNNFTVPAVLGSPAGFETLPSRIYNDLNFATTTSAFLDAQVLAASLALAALVILLPAARLMGTRAEVTPAVSASGGLRLARRLPLLAVGAYLTVAVLGPLAGLALTAVTRAPGLPPTPANWSLVNFDQAVSGARFLPALSNSILLAMGSASILLGLGLAVAALERRRGGRTISTALTLGFAVPGSVLAVAFLLAYGRWFGGSLLIILLAYVAKLWALAHRPLSGAIKALPRGFSLAARASGASSSATLRTIVVPILAPALGAAWALVFLFALHEVTISSLLYGPTSQTLAVLVLNIQQVGDVGSSAALACALTALVLVPAGALGLLLRRHVARSA
ncbi:MAG: ABC transporter permease [Candidatus Dormibacteria bacterium]